MGISESGVYYHGLRAGLTTKAATNGPLVDRRGRRRFTPDEDARITELRMQGLTMQAIGDKVGRKSSSIFMRLQTLASREDA